MPPTNASPHLLIVRFSSFGDIFHGISVPYAFKEKYPNAKVDWLVRQDFASLLNDHPSIDRVIAFDRRASVGSLTSLAWRLSGEPFTHLYDAHNNVRSAVFCAVFRLRRLFDFEFNFIRRSKERVRRWLLFRFHVDLLPRPFKSAESFHRPLIPWGLSAEVPDGPQFFPQDPLPNDVQREIDAVKQIRPSTQIVALAASAAWEMKRWPEDHWRELIRLLPESHFVLLGGPEDRFLNEIVKASPSRALNLAGRLTLSQSAALLKQVDLVISNDTGILHVADQMERPTIALIGPTAFGYPSHRTSKTLEIELWCKPCSKDGSGRCKNDLYKRCLVELTPTRVADEARAMLDRTTT